MTDEVWAQVPGLKFMASTEGRIRNLDRTVTFEREGQEQTCRLRGRVISPWMNKTGYLAVSQKEAGVRKKYLAHRLVGMAFVPGYSPELSINHKNGIKTDNRPDNLEWCTLEENTKHQWQAGLADTNKGENHNFAKLADAKVIELRARALAGERPSLLAKEYGVCHSYVCMLKKGRRRARTV